MTFGDPWTDDQQRLARVLYDVWEREHARWPNFAYVEHEMRKQDLDAKAVLASFPVVGRVEINSPCYGDVGYDRVTALGPDTEIRLTLAGLSKMGPDADAPVGLFMSFLREAGKVRLAAVLDPFTVTPVEISKADFDTLPEDSKLRTTSLWAAVAGLVQTEPYAVTGLRLIEHPSGSEWTARIGSKAAQYDGGVGAQEYLIEVVRILTPPRLEQPRVLPSPLGLLTALDYLNVTWKLHCRRDLVQPGTMQGTARLAADIGNEDEFSGRLSTLGDLLKSLQIPSEPKGKEKKHSLVHLESYLLERLSDQNGQDSINRVFPVLRGITEIRNGLQHASAAPERLTAWQELGLTYPPTDWNETWLTVRAKATEAIMDLRDLVERLPAGGRTEHTG
jgi:hypothetical protein